MPLAIDLASVPVLASATNEAAGGRGVQAGRQAGRKFWGAHNQATIGDACRALVETHTAASYHNPAIPPEPEPLGGAPGCICVAISSARPSVVTPSAAMRHMRGSSSKTEARRPPTISRPAAPRPSLVIHRMAAEAATAPTGPVLIPRAEIMVLVASECDTQPLMCAGDVHSWYGK